MSLLESIAAFLPGILSGILIVGLLWDDDTPAAILLKLCLGTGIGLGLVSLLYFLYMLAFAGAHWFIFAEIACLGLLVWVSLRQNRLHFPRIGFSGFRIWQAGIVAGALPVIGLAILGASSVWTHRPFGTWDAFMIYDRTARFVYRGQADWMQTFSPDIDPAFHADYPMLIQLDIAQGWEALGRESQSVPRALGSIFMLICAGAFLGGLTLLRSFWQGLAGLLVLLNTPFFILGGPSQTADVPLSFFILSTVVLIFLYMSDQQPGLLVLSGVCAGLAAWTKNEGDVFLVGIVAGLFLAFLRREPWRKLGYFGAGLALPLAVVLYFKLFLAPANDILGTDTAGLIQRVFEWPRHLAILNSFRSQILGIGGPWVSVIPLLAVYALAIGLTPVKAHRPAYLAVLVAAGIQTLGYYAIYLVTPHPIEWQLDFSLWRVLLHIYLPLLFLFFALVTDIPQALGFRAKTGAAEGVA